ncbi:glycosyltransferase [Lutibacter sp.]|uniref:glycosyltransferase n=1 Tax=Lutibacter sp. TaxID=1925666 RepID=UPI001A2C8183|nr:glycosyltransferase [Lutibacter sp.]MBI9042306.1 glycosyltransferase family 4 protein [Lutibacter sp.]
MKNLLIIGFVWPEPSSTAAGKRMLQIIELFLEENYNITFVSTATKNKTSFPLENLGITTFNIELNNNSFDELILQVNPSIVLFDRYLTEEQFGWRILENCPKALKILDTEDLHFLRYARKTALKKNSTNFKEFIRNDITLRELASIYRCDLTLIISQFELDLLIEEFNLDTSLLCYLPFLLNSIEHKKMHIYPSFNERAHFMTIGNFRHEPNYNAVLNLKNNIWPLIKNKLPKAEMHVYGAYASEKVYQLQNVKDHFFIKGWIENSEEAYINSRICLAPIQFGAGLKGKLIESMQFGTPNITTTIGAEGMFNGLNWNGFIENDAEKFADKAIELYENQKIWLQSQENGVNIINNCFSKEKYGLLFSENVNFILNHLEKHRQNNFIGLMLSHHKMKSTKYLSKWIEEKNKNL